MKKNLTELVFVTDMSGSMDHLTDDTIGGFNSILREQKEVDGEVYLSAVLFNDEEKVLYDRVDIREVPEMTRKDYQARGCTALLDALGGAIHHIGNVHKYAREEDVPEKTLFVVTTDGMENASFRYSYEQVKKMVEHEQEKYGWEFLFLGANIDAYEAGARMGFRRERIANYIADSEGSGRVYDSVNRACVSLRSCAKMIDNSWSEEIDKDYKARKK